MIGAVAAIRGERWADRLQHQLAMPPLEIGDWMAQHTRLLKCDQNSQVGLLHLDRVLCCLKFYADKSPLHRLRYRLGRGRAVHSFDIALQLADAGLPVATPFACLRITGGALLLSEGIREARSLRANWLDRPAPSVSKQVLTAAGEVLGGLHRAGYAHGDCKWSNLLYSDGAVTLVDLDATRASAHGGARQARDLARFTLDAEELEIGVEAYQLFLQSYCLQAAVSREGALRRMRPILQKLRARHLARYGDRGRRLL